jgi:predicted alpha/beta superfamily hydrolase
MTTESEPYGAELLAEIRKINRLDLVTGKFDYEAIQRLKQADRDATLKLFQGSSYAFLQLIKTKQPAEVVQALVESQQQYASTSAALIAVIAIQ